MDGRTETIWIEEAFMIAIKELTKAARADFVSLMQTDAQCSHCWCLNHRAPTGCDLRIVFKRFFERKARYVFT